MAHAGAGIPGSDNQKSKPGHGPGNFRRDEGDLDGAATGGDQDIVGPQEVTLGPNTLYYTNLSKAG